MTDISVIVATYNRADLLYPAFYTYSKQKTDLKWEYILVDDMSTDGTKELAMHWQQNIPLIYYTSEDLGLPKDPTKWRDGCALRNRASTRARGRFIILTHPEIMVPPDALESMYAAAEAHYDERAWVTAIPYWLPEGKMKPWKADLHRLRETDGFYDPDWPNESAAPGAIDYTNQNQETRLDWESEVFAGMWMRDWRWFGGFREFTQWGSVDIDQLNRRRACDFKTVVARSEDSPHKENALMVYHQWHKSPRDMEKALEGVQGVEYSDCMQARKAGGLYNIYHHGPRERALTPGTTEGILGDHLARYEWAAFFSKDKDILDIPCGTGYGALTLARANAGFRSYLGVDIDPESIEWALDNYYDSKTDFQVGDMLDIPAKDASFDRVYCFEGIEHVEDQDIFIMELYRVLRPGGSFIISTPNPKNAPGTAWDINMLTGEQLAELFSGDRWQRLDWFYQISYGLEHSPVLPGMHEDAQITILGGTKKKT